MFGVVDECFHLPLSERAPAGAGESTSKSRSPHYPDAFSVDGDSSTGPFQDSDAYLFQDTAYLIVLVAVVVVIAKDRKDGNGHALQLRCKCSGLVYAPVRCKVTCKKEHIGMPVQLGPVFTKLGIRGIREVHVPDCCYSNQLSPPVRLAC